MPRLHPLSGAPGGLSCPFNRDESSTKRYPIVNSKRVPLLGFADMQCSKPPEEWEVHPFCFEKGQGVVVHSYSHIASRSQQMSNASRRSVDSVT